MAFLDAVKGLFGRKEDALNPPDTMWLADQLHTADGESEALLKPLPLIGRYAYSVQLGLVLAVLIATGVLFLALFIGVYLFSSHNAAMRSLATDMQVLSQRVVTASAAGDGGHRAVHSRQVAAGGVGAARRAVRQGPGRLDGQ